MPDKKPSDVIDALCAFLGEESVMSAAQVRGWYEARTTGVRRLHPAKTLATSPDGRRRKTKAKNTLDFSLLVGRRVRLHLDRMARRFIDGEVRAGTHGYFLFDPSGASWLGFFTLEQRRRGGGCCCLTANRDVEVLA